MIHSNENENKGKAITKRIRERIEKIDDVLKLEEKDQRRVKKILDAVQRGAGRIGEFKGIACLRKSCGVGTLYFQAYYPWLLEKGLIKTSWVSEKKGMGEWWKKPELTEKGEGALGRLIEKKRVQPDPTTNELTIERYGGARRIKIKFTEDVELRRILWPFGISGRWPFRLIFDDSRKIEIEPRDELDTLESLEGMMWSFMVHSSSPDEGWSAYPEIGGEMSFKLPDEFGLSRSMTKLKRDYNYFWGSPSSSGESKLNEGWTPDFLRDLAPKTIEALTKALEEWKGWEDRENLKSLDPSRNLTWEETREREIKELEERIKRWKGAEKKRQWISKMLEYDPNIFLPSPLWQELGFLEEKDVVWPVEVSLPFNVNIAGWKELEIFLEILAQIDSLSDADLVGFTRPFDWGREEEVELPHLGSPSIFISFLERYQANPVFYAVWRWRENRSRELKELLKELEKKHGEIRGERFPPHKKLEELKELLKELEKKHGEIRGERFPPHKKLEKPKKKELELKKKELELKEKELELKEKELELKEKELGEECKRIRRTLSELKNKRARATNILLPVDIAYKRFIHERAPKEAYVNLAQVYLDVWKRCAGKKMTEEKIASVVGKVADAISKGKYDLDPHPKRGKSTT
jgi:hypothetical protein